MCLFLLGSESKETIFACWTKLCKISWRSHRKLGSSFFRRWKCRKCLWAGFQRGSNLSTLDSLKFCISIWLTSLSISVYACNDLCLKNSYSCIELQFAMLESSQRTTMVWYIELSTTQINITLNPIKLVFIRWNTMWKMGVGIVIVGLFIGRGSPAPIWSRSSENSGVL